MRFFKNCFSRNGTSITQNAKIAREGSSLKQPSGTLSTLFGGIFNDSLSGRDKRETSMSIQRAMASQQGNSGPPASTLNYDHTSQQQQQQQTVTEKRLSMTEFHLNPNNSINNIEHTDALSQSLPLNAQMYVQGGDFFFIVFLLHFNFTFVFIIIFRADCHHS